MDRPNTPSRFRAMPLARKWTLSGSFQVFAHSDVYLRPQRASKESSHFKLPFDVRTMKVLAKLFELSQLKKYTYVPISQKPVGISQKHFRGESA